MTELMDNDLYRQENEFILSILQSLILNSDNIDYRYAPYATRCIQCAYRSAREDNIFAKNASVVLSKFQIEYKDIKCDAILLLNINLDNNVATVILVGDFNGSTANDIIRLKHILYSRTLVSIRMFKVGGGVCSNGTHKFACLDGMMDDAVFWTTIQDFISSQFPQLVHGLYTYYDIDFRARYSMVELSIIRDNQQYMQTQILIEDNQLLSELYGILTADEGYESVRRDILVRPFETNLSTRNNYSTYLFGLNGIIINHTQNRSTKCLIIDNENRPREHIEYEFPQVSCIPGIEKEMFSSYLKSVEIHHLINMEMTNEIESHGRSYTNPIIFLKRMKHLWSILYELDVNRYHIDDDFMASFGITEVLESIRQEYRDLLQQMMNFIMAIIAFITAILTCAQICG